MEFELYKHQWDAIKQVKDRDKVAFYMECGLGKTFTSAVLAYFWGDARVLIVCPKALIKSWQEEIKKFFGMSCVDLSKKIVDYTGFGVINYNLLYRREELFKWTDYTLIFDESSKLMHSNTKTTKAALKLTPKHLILLSGSPSGGGHYENLHTQAKLLGVNMTKTKWWDNFVKYRLVDFGNGARIPQIYGYKNTDAMMSLLKEHGAVFMRSEDVFDDMPDRVDKIVDIDVTPEYKKFLKDRIVVFNDEEFVGDTALSKRLRARMLCGCALNKDKLNRIEDMLVEIDSRVLIFYTFRRDFDALKKLCEKLNRPVSFINGDGRDLTAYEECENSVTLAQYTSAGYGLNLQKAHHLIHSSLCESCDAYIQSEARIRRIGQESDRCVYYYLLSGVEKDIYKNLKRGNDYSDALFEKYLEMNKK